MRERLEEAFSRWARLTHRNPIATVIACLVVLIPLIAQIRHIQIDVSPESFLDSDDPIAIAFDEFRSEFGRDDLILLAIRAPDLFAPSFLERLRALHNELENDVPKIQEVRSLINARETRGLKDELIVGDLFDPWPSTPEELADRKRRTLANPLYTDLLISSDGRTAALTIELDTYADQSDTDLALAGFGDEPGEGPDDAGPVYLSGAETNRVIDSVNEIVASYRSDEFEIYAAGSQMMVYDLGNMMQRDMRTFTLMAVATIGVLLGFLFRRLAGVVLPLLVVMVSMVSTIGLLSAMGFVVSLPTQILPSLLLAVAIGDSVHVLTIFYLRFDAGDSREDAIAYSLEHSGLPILMTSLTTAGGLVAFVTAEIAPIANLGVVAPAGVIIAFILSVTLLPALVALFPMKPRSSDSADTVGRLRTVLVACGDFGIDHARPVVVVAALVAGISALGASYTTFGHDVLRWFPPDHQYRLATELINEEMGGAITFEVLVNTGKENGLHDPATLNNFARAATEVLEYQDEKVKVYKAISIVDVVEEIHQALNENQPDMRRIPSERALVAQELLLFENSGSDDLLDFADSSFQTGRITIKTPFIDAAAYAPYIVMMQARLADIFGEGVEAAFTGLLPVLSQTVYAVIHSMASSYVIAIAVITPLMVLLIGSLRIGLLAMVPNILPILAALGAMGWLGIPIDVFSMMVGAICIGLVVDDTIHVMHGFQRNFDRYGDVRSAMRETLSSTGLAILFTTVALSAGFGVYTISAMSNLIRFGTVTAIVIVLAFLADIILAPALLSLVLGKKKSDSSAKENNTSAT